ncbi:CoA transferase [Neobacillus niacini]|uniref:CoA transferase n=1 Tax=Neobacillus niacini TaxID=86668 RepID=UPI00286A2419|nr:CoA transferase [Neobacillus niacini]
MIVEVEHPTIQNLKLTGSPLKLSKTPVTIRKHPPKQGEHTDLILQHIGFSENEISNLKSNKII